MLSGLLTGVQLTTVVIPDEVGGGAVDATALTVLLAARRLVAGLGHVRILCA